MEQGEKSGQKVLDDLLKISLKLSEQEEAPLAETDIEPERKEFLQHALQNILDNDDSKQLEFYTKGLCDYSILKDNLSEQQLNELYEICDGINFLLEGFDMNIVFKNCGGLDACLLLLEKEYPEVQWRVLDLIAHSVQNNEKCQAEILNKNGLQTLFKMLTTAKDEMVCIKSLYAISGLVGGNTAAEQLFISLNGLSIVAKFINHTNLKVRLKSAFLLNKVIKTEASAEVDTSKLIVPMVFSLRKETSEEHACIAGLLANLLEKNSKCKEVFRKTSDGLKDILVKRVADLKTQDAEMHQETIDSYTNLLNFI